MSKKYETSIVGYETIKTLPNYKINTKTGKLINKTNLIMGNSKTKEKRILIHIGTRHYFLDELVYLQKHADINFKKYKLIHINNDITDNRIKNLKKERIKQSRRLILETSLTTNKQTIYKTFTAPAQKRLINPGMIKFACDKIIEKAISKKNNKSYTYKYINEDEFKKLKSKGVKLYSPQK